MASFLHSVQSAEVPIQMLEYGPTTQRRQQVSKYFLFLPLLLAFGCAPVATTQVANLSASETAVSIQDLRPPEERLSERFSILVSNPAYGIERLGDERLIPNRVRLLQHRVFEKFNQDKSNSPVSVKLNHFVVYSNMASLGRRMAFNSAPGAISGALTHDPNTQKKFETSFDVPTDKEYTRGLFQPAENPDDETVFIVYIDAEISGKRGFVRLVYPHTNERGEFNKAHVDGVEKAIENLLKQL